MPAKLMKHFYTIAARKIFAVFAFAYPSKFPPE